MDEERDGVEKCKKLELLRSKPRTSLSSHTFAMRAEEEQDTWELDSIQNPSHEARPTLEKMMVVLGRCESSTGNWGGKQGGDEKQMIETKIGQG